MFIVIYFRDQAAEKLAVTIESIYNALEYIRAGRKERKGKFWRKADVDRDAGGKDEWKHLVVCLMTDGNVDGRVQPLIEQMGLWWKWNTYPEGHEMRLELENGEVYTEFPKTLKGKAVTAHLFEVGLSYPSTL